MPGFRVWRDEIEDRVANTGRVVATPGAQNGCIHRPSYTRGGGGFCKRENDFGALGGRPVDWDE